jgi:hypothetical protein
MLGCAALLCFRAECRLDKSLTIGQMQGKFQLVLMPTAGHAIQVGRVRGRQYSLMSTHHRRMQPYACGSGHNCTCCLQRH